MFGPQDGVSFGSQGEREVVSEVDKELTDCNEQLLVAMELEQLLKKEQQMLKNEQEAEAEAVRTVRSFFAISI